MSRNNRLLGRLLGEGAAMIVPALLGALLFAITRAAASPAPPETAEASPPPEVPDPCGATHPARGESSPLDLEAVRRGYLDLRNALGASLDRSRIEVERALDRPYDAGLGACRKALVRQYIPAAPLPPALWGRRLAFMAVRDPSRVCLPRAIEEDPAAEILIVAAARPRDLGEISKILGRRVSLAGAELARELGVRCANTWIEIGEKGDAVIIHEGD